MSLTVGSVYKKFLPKPLCIRLLRKGCANRPFYQIIVVPMEARSIDEGIEQLGVYDPMPNERNERLLSLNIDRFKYYVANGAWVNSTMGMLLGTAGVGPIHPHSLTLAWRARQRQAEAEKQTQEADSGAGA